MYYVRCIRRKCNRRFRLFTCTSFSSCSSCSDLGPGIFVFTTGRSKSLPRRAAELPNDSALVDPAAAAKQVNYCITHSASLERTSNQIIDFSTCSKLYPHLPEIRRTGCRRCLYILLKNRNRQNNNSKNTNKKKHLLLFMLDRKTSKDIKCETK